MSSFLYEKTGKSVCVMCFPWEQMKEEKLIYLLCTVNALIRTHTGSSYQFFVDQFATFVNLIVICFLLMWFITNSVILSQCREINCKHLLQDSSLVSNLNLTVNQILWLPIFNDHTSFIKRDKSCCKYVFVVGEFV